MVGPNTYRLLDSSLAPRKPGEKSYSELVALLTTRYNPIIPRQYNDTSFTHE